MIAYSVTRKYSVLSQCHLVCFDRQCTMLVNFLIIDIWGVSG